MSPHTDLPAPAANASPKQSDALRFVPDNRIIVGDGQLLVLNRRGTFTLREIESMTKLDEDAPLGLRAQITRRRLYVTGSKVGLLRLKLRRARRFWAVLGAEADVIVFDVESPDAFLESFAGRMASLAPIEPKRADPYLRD